MKIIKMDWETYQIELRNQKQNGYKEGLADCRRLVLEIIAGATDDNLFFDASDDKLWSLLNDLRPRLQRYKEIYEVLK